MGERDGDGIVGTRDVGPGESAMRRVTCCRNVTYPHAEMRVYAGGCVWAFATRHGAPGIMLPPTSNAPEVGYAAASPLESSGSF